MCFFFNDTATTEIYTLSLHDALPICEQVPLPLPAPERLERRVAPPAGDPVDEALVDLQHVHRERSEEHTSELQSRQYLVCRLLLEKKSTARMRWPQRRAATVGRTSAR